MRIIHSFWSKPFLQKNYSRHSGGWLSKKYNYYSWALSCLQFKCYYDNVELITDRFGKDVLIEKMRLPYSSVSTILDDLDKMNPLLWAVSKHKCFDELDGHYIHADGDIFIWARLPELTQSSSLIVQHVEKNFSYYTRIVNAVKEQFEYIPDFLRNCWIENELHAFNTGIIGGLDAEFLKEYAKESLMFIQKNESRFNKFPVAELGIFDQHFLYAYAKHYKKEVNCVLESVDESFQVLNDFKGVPLRQNYLHPVSNFKKDNQTCWDLERRLQFDHPYYFHRINYLLDKGLI